MPRLWTVESQVWVDFEGIIPALCADVHEAKAYLSYYFLVYTHFFWAEGKSQSEFSDMLNMKGTFRRLLRLFIWVCFPPNINVYEPKKKSEGVVADGIETGDCFCHFDIQVTHFCFSMFTLWLWGEPREAVSPGCQNQAGELSQHRWRHMHHLGVCRWRAVTDTHCTRSFVRSVSS